MRLFTRLYDRALRWSSHRYASRYLAGLSFAESSFFPVPPDVMLAPMCLADNGKATYFAFIATCFSVLGGAFGYLIGHYAFEFVQPFISESPRYQLAYDTAVAWFNDWGVWVVLLAGFSPIPYKVFTIAAGAAGMAFLPFLLASAVGRGLRFYMVAFIIRWGGDRMEQMLRRYVEYLGWLLVVAAIILFLMSR